MQKMTELWTTVVVKTNTDQESRKSEIRLFERISHLCESGLYQPKSFRYGWKFGPQMLVFLIEMEVCSLWIQPAQLLQFIYTSLSSCHQNLHMFTLDVTQSISFG